MNKEINSILYNTLSRLINLYEPEKLCILQSSINDVYYPYTCLKELKHLDNILNESKEFIEDKELKFMSLYRISFVQLKIFIQHGFILSNYKESISINTPLHTQNDIAVIELLIKNGLDVNARNINGNTPIIIHMNNPYLVKLFVKNGADISITNRMSQNILHLCRNLETVKYVTRLEKINPFHKDYKGRTSLYCQHTNFEIFIIIANYAQHVIKRSSSHFTSSTPSNKENNSILRELIYNTTHIKAMIRSSLSNNTSKNKLVPNKKELAKKSIIECEKLLRKLNEIYSQLLRKQPSINNIINSSWKNDINPLDRQNTINNITNWIYSKDSYLYENEFLKKQVLKLSKIMEERLFKSASSLEIYKDMNTLDMRLKKIIVDLKKEKLRDISSLKDTKNITDGHLYNLIINILSNGHNIDLLKKQVARQTDRYYELLTEVQMHSNSYRSLQDTYDSLKNKMENIIFIKNSNEPNWRLDKDILALKKDMINIILKYVTKVPLDSYERELTIRRVELAENIHFRLSKNLDEYKNITTLIKRLDSIKSLSLDNDKPTLEQLLN